MTIDEIFEQIYIKLGEPIDGSGFVSNTELFKIANECQFDLNTRTESVWAQETKSIYKNQWQIELPTDIIKLNRVLYDNSKALIHVSPGYMDTEYPGWESRSWGTPDYYFMYDINKRLCLDRQVNKNTTLILDYIKIPDELDDVTDEPEFDSALDECFIIYAQYKLSLLEMTSDKIKQAYSFYGEYLNKIMMFNDQALKRKTGRQARISTFTNWAR